MPIIGTILKASIAQRWLVFSFLALLSLGEFLSSFFESHIVVSLIL